MNIPIPEIWLDKPYYSLHAYCMRQFGEKLYKIALDAGMTCPNRDGTLDTKGCIFCSAGGSGDYAVKTESVPVADQIRQGLSLFHTKKTGSRFIAYFQAYTNTYAPVPRLRRIFEEALVCPDIAGISIATRPDCIGEDVLHLLTGLNNRYPDKFIWVELGLQTIHEATASYIRRGYPLSCFTQAVQALSQNDIDVITHVILGLPGETAQMAYDTIGLLNTLPIQGIKLQLLHILRGTDLETDYRAGVFSALTIEEYLELLIGCIERLRPDTVIHRLTGDGPRRLLLAPLWSLDKRLVLNTLHREMKARNTWQGRRFL